MLDQHRYGLLLLHRSHYKAWPAHRRVALHRELDAALRQWVLSQADANGLVAVYRDDNGQRQLVNATEATPWRLCSLPLVALGKRGGADGPAGNRLRLVLYLRHYPAIQALGEWYQWDWMLSVLMVDAEDASLDTLIRANNAFMSVLFARIVEAESKVRRAPTRAKSKKKKPSREGRLRMDAGRVKSRIERDKVIIQFGRDYIQTFGGGDPGVVTEYVWRRCRALQLANEKRGKGLRGWPDSKQTYRRKLAGLFGSKRPRKKK